MGNSGDKRLVREFEVAAVRHAHIFSTDTRKDCDGALAKLLAHMRSIRESERQRCAAIADEVAGRWDDPYNENPAAEVARRIKGTT